MTEPGDLFSGGDVANLPLLQSDETLYSWAGAVHCWNPVPDVRETSRRLYGSPFAALQHDFPSHLGSLCRKLGDGMGSPSSLALRHSLLGYFLPARPLQFSTRILGAAEVGAVSSLKFQLGIPASRVGGWHHLKGCQQCFASQVRMHGRAYWRVVHQLPSAFCCAEHEEILQVAWDSITPVHRRGWILPLGGLPRTWRAYPSVSEKQFSRLKRLGDFSTQWASQRPSSFGAERLALVYRTSLREYGLMTQAGSLRLGDIVRLVRHHYSGLEGFAELNAIHHSEASWSTLVGAASRRVPRPCHPLKHLLLISALFATWEDFVLAYESVPEEPVGKHVKAIALPDEKSAHSDFGNLVRHRGLSISAAGRSVGITATTAVRWAKVLGLPYKARPKTYTSDRLDEARGLLRKGALKAQVAGQLGFSLGAVDRLISSEPELSVAWRAARYETAREANRSKFLKVLAGMRGCPLKEIRAVAGSGYSWLYKHDRPWLINALPFFGQLASHNEGAF